MQRGSTAKISGAMNIGTYLVIDECSQRKEVEEICKASPNIGVAIFAQAFVVEPVYLRDLS